ncbi:MAG: vWA domain-containing protein [Bacteroidales bacterium]
MKTKGIIIIATFLVFFLSNNGLGQGNKSEKAKVQIALLLDVSNSMDGLIDQAKSQLWKIVNDLALAEYNGQTPDLQIALYEYGNDGLPSSEGYIRQVSMFTTDLDKISEDLFALKTNGGSEFCGQVIDVSLKQLSWTTSNQDLKMIFIAGNEPFTQGGVDYKESCKKAISKGIIVNTIFCGNYDEGVSTFWKDGADVADGKYMNIDQNIKEVYIASPYDDQIMKLNNQLNQTYIGYGSSGQALKERQVTQDNNAGAMSEEVQLNRAVSKSQKAYSNESWDLVDAYKKDEKKIENLSDDELPKELKGKSKAEIKTFLDQKQKERDKIQKEINDLNEKRTKYVAEKKKEMANDNTLDAVMIKAVREQAVKKNYKFKK